MPPAPPEFLLPRKMEGNTHWAVKVTCRSTDQEHFRRGSQLSPPSQSKGGLWFRRAVRPKVRRGEPGEATGAKFQEDRHTPAVGSFTPQGGHGTDVCSKGSEESSGGLRAATEEHSAAMKMQSFILMN